MVEKKRVCFPHDANVMSASFLDHTGQAGSYLAVWRNFFLFPKKIPKVMHTQSGENLKIEVTHSVGPYYYY